jgi:hypothetical protein
MTNTQAKVTAQAKAAELPSAELEQISGGLTSILKHPFIYCGQGIPRNLLPSSPLSQVINPVINQGIGNLSQPVSVIR